MLITQKEIPILIDLESYSKVIKSLKHSIDGSTKILPLIFDKDVKFINPFFIIKIFNLLEYVKKRKSQSQIIIDITNMDEKNQPWVLNFLAQYIDYDIILLQFSDQTDIFNYDKKYQKLYGFDQQIILYHSTYKNYTNSNISQEKEYGFLPITRITPFANELNKYSDNARGDENLIRKKYYDYLQLDVSDETIEIDKTTYKLEQVQTKSEYIWNQIFSKYLNIIEIDKDTMTGLSNIVNELVSNIKKHTQYGDNKANGYISFYKDKKEKRYEFLICDNYDKGFLDTYLNTMHLERSSEENLTIQKEYDEIIENLNINNNDQKNIEILEKIFNLEYIFSAQQKRIVKHFGIPLLLKLLSKIENSILDIYVHRNENVYHISYENSKAKVKKVNDASVKGTYIHISFPLKPKLDFVIFKDEILNIYAKKYESYFRTDSIIKRQFEKFERINFKQIEEKYIPKNSGEKKSIYIIYDEGIEVSNFLRKIYSYSYLNHGKVKDILICNFPIRNHINYLEIYQDTVSIEKISNILFLNNTDPQAMFIGGKTKEKMLSVNQILATTYNYDKTNFTVTPDIPVNNNIINLESNLFYKDNDNKESFIPFELYVENDFNLLYMNMIDNVLNTKDNNEDIHLDLNNGLHIKKFYYLKHIFEDSTWIDRIAFDFAKKIKNEENLNEIVFIGVEKYSSLILSIARTILDKHINIYIIEELEDTKSLKEFENFKKYHHSKKFVFFRPVVFDGYLMNNFLEGITFSLYCAIKIEYQGMQPIKNPWNFLLKKDITSVILDQGINCEKCFLGQDEPLYEIDSDKYNIKNHYRGSLQSIKKEKNEMNISWLNSIYFGHVKRGSNHYLYYIKTIQFLKNNYMQIVSHFKRDAIQRGNDKEKTPILFSPSHNTNSDFITLIDKTVFNNKAIIYSLNVDNKEQVLYSLNRLKEQYNGNTGQYEFYFIDDEIASGNVLEYFFGVLNHLIKDFKFRAVFTLIDRRSKTNQNFILNKYYKYFYSFTKLNIQPIQTDMEECYLCEQQKKLKIYAKDSSLIFVKNELQKKSKKLSLLDAPSVEYLNIEQIDDFKNYLKMYAVKYVYQNINDFFDIEVHFKKYTENVELYFDKFYLNSSGITKEIRKIIHYESKIAFIKTLSFPKVVFFKNLRLLIHKYIKEEIEDNIKVKKGGRELKVDLSPIIDYSEIQLLKTYTNIKGIVSYYEMKSKTKVNYVNFLITTASSLNINYILEEEMIDFYYKLTVQIKAPLLYKRYKKLLGIYPVAIKLITSYSKEKSEYFNKSLSKFIDDNPLKYNRQFSRIFGLYVDNRKVIEYKLKNILEDRIGQPNQEITLLSHIKYLEDELIKFFVNNSFKIEIESFYINIYNDIFIDLFSSFQESNNHYINIMYDGASVKDVGFEDIIDIEYNPNKDNNNIWCNFHHNSKTYIRITSNSLIPLGVIVVKHSDNLIEHLLISRALLMIQNSIVTFFENNNLLPKIREAYGSILKVNESEKEKHIANLELDKKEQENYIMELKNTHFKDMVHKLSHGAIRDLNNAILGHQKNPINIDTIYEDTWIAYCNSKIGQMYFLKVNNNSPEDIVCDVGEIPTSSLKNLNRYITHININDSDTNINFNVVNQINVPIKAIYLEIFITLLIENARKFSKSDRLINIDFCSDTHTLSISNNNITRKGINYKEINDNMKKAECNGGITLYAINRYLEEISWNLIIEPEFNNSFCSIKIKPLG